MPSFLKHYGMPRRSGRYPWGSGENPFQHMNDIYTRYNKLRDEGKSEKEIAEEFDTTTTQLRKIYRMAKDEVKNEQRAQAKRLRNEGWSNEAIAKELGLAGESSVRSLLNEGSVERAKKASIAAEYLRNAVDESNQPIILSPGVEKEVGVRVSKEKLDEAVLLLQKDGYEVYNRRIPQPTNPGKYTTVSVLCPPGTEYKDIYDIERLRTLTDYTQKANDILVDNGSKIRKKFEYPASMDSKRMDICYAEDGGEAKDGLIEIRRGVTDLSLGEANYAQVRILVDGTHYLKGMAAYADDLPEGIDIRFNTNKKKGTPALGDDKNNTVLKKIKDDPDNPFNSLIKENGGQSYYDDPNGKYIDPETGKKQSLSLINKRADEGDWGDWSHSLPSQFLAKQSKDLAKRQLDIAASDRELEFNEIRNLNNPTVKKKLLAEFARSCDAASVHLKAAALPRQQYQVILPLTTLKENEVYAPNYRDGEKVALIRYPHGGTFEIPILTVNNKNKEGERMMGKNPKDAVGIRKEVADRLSGADFDGDTVMVIPTNDVIKINSTPKLKELEGFDPHIEYAGHEGMQEMHNTQNEMGKVSNLITDMTIKGANSDEIAKAVKHSMVVIDAEKHHLDYKQSEADNDIKLLKKKYMLHTTDEGKESTGASTLISRASAQASVDKRRGDPWINQEGKKWYDPSKPEGALIFKTADDKDLYYPERKPVKKKDPNTGKYMKDDKGKFVYETYIDDNGNERVKYAETGKIKTRTQKSTQMAEVEDARKLVSEKRHPMELLYADYANHMKSLANEARKEMVTTDRLKYDKNAAKIYKPQVESLEKKLEFAESNKQKEMQAVLLANKSIERKLAIEPEIRNNKKDLQKLHQREMTKARAETGAQRNPIELTDAEWEAIQSGAISENKLMKILNYTDTDKIRERATPRAFKEISPAKQQRIKSMKASDLTNAEIAQALGISTTTVSRYLNGEE